MIDPPIHMRPGVGVVRRCVDLASCVSVGTVARKRRAQAYAM